MDDVINKQNQIKELQGRIRDDKESINDILKYLETLDGEWVLPENFCNDGYCWDHTKYDYCYKYKFGTFIPKGEKKASLTVPYRIETWTV